MQPYLGIVGAIVLTLHTLPAQATVGEDNSLHQLCFDQAANQLRWIEGNANEGYARYGLGLGDGVPQQETPNADFVSQIDLGPSCFPLGDSIDLAALKIKARAYKSGAIETHFKDNKGRIVLPDSAERPHCPTELRLSQQGKRLAAVKVSPCCREREISVLGYLIPGTNQTVLLLNYRGKCYEGGYRVQKLFVIDGIKRATAPQLQGPQKVSSNQSGGLTVPLPKRKVDMPRLNNDAARPR